MTTRDHEFDEANQAAEPPPEAETLKVTLMSVEEFLGQAQEPTLAAIIDTQIETIQTTTGADDRKMLRAFMLVMRSIATSMPWDENLGVDARRFHVKSKTALPSWRQCIGACLQLEFTKPDEPIETLDAQAEEIEAEKAADESDD